MRKQTNFGKQVFLAPLKQLKNQTDSCSLCPRLRMHCSNIAQVKRAAYRAETYWGKPVAGFGDPHPLLWIVGLAPGAHGANRTGRVFTGDKSGEWLYSALFRFGWSSSPVSQDLSDDLQLHRVYISCVVRCAPPDNKPSQEELQRCYPYLEKEWEILQKPPLILCLGKVAFDQVKKLLFQEFDLRKLSSWTFKHGSLYCLEEDNKKTQVLASYHPSQQNTQTGRLTLAMWNGIFEKAREVLKH